MCQEDTCSRGNVRIMEQSNENKEFKSLLFKLVEDEISQEQFADLERMIQEDPSCLQYYIEFMSVNTGLRKYAGVLRDTVRYGSVPPAIDTALWEALAEVERSADTVEVEKPVEIKSEPISGLIKVPVTHGKVSRLLVMTSLISMAAFVFLAVLVWLNPVAPPPVAVLAESIDTMWGNPEFEPELWSELPVGTMTLLKGYAKITLYGGADIVIEGPAEINLESSGQVYLSRGKLFAVVHEGAEKIVVRTPDATIIDYGTEFGVKVSQAGFTEAHVFKGEVELRAGSDIVRHGEIKRLKANQAAAVNSVGKFVELVSDAKKFMRHVPKEYELAMIESKPLSYWSFERNEPDSIRIGLDGRFSQGPDIGAGAWSDSLVFDGDSGVVLDLPDSGTGASNAYTFMAWVRLAEIKRQCIAINEISTAGVGYVRRIEINDNGRFSHSFLGLEPQDGPGNSKIWSDTIVRADKWYHVVVTSKTPGQKRMYINGEIDSKPFSQGGFSHGNYSRVHLGKPMNKTVKYDGDNFTGEIADVAVFDRQLSAIEIRNIYQAAKGQSSAY